MKARTKFSTAVGMASLLLGATAQAAEAPKWYETTKVSGFLEGYYKLNLDGRKSAGSSTSSTVFDKHQNVFALQGGKVELSTADALVDLYFGDYGNSLQPTVGTEAAAIGQAYISQPVGPTTVTFGRFFTHLGYEVNDAVANVNFTRGLLFSQLPFYHQGVKVNYAPVEGLGLMAMLDNGNSVNYPTTNETAGGAQVSYTGITGLATYFNYYYQPLPGLVWEKKHFLEFVGTYGLMEGLTLGANYLYTTSIAAGDTDSVTGNVLGTNMVDPATGKLVAYSPKMNAYALYLDYATPVEGLSVTPRFEAAYLPDNGNAGDGMTRFDYTLTARYTKGSLINWLEWRTDAADDAIFPAPVNDPGKASYTESSLTYALGYKF